MDTVIYNPLEEYEKKYKEKHSNATNTFFEELVAKSNVDIEANRKTVEQYNIYKENLVVMKRKLNWLRFFRVLMCITIVLIPLVITKMTPKIRALREEIEIADNKADELLALAYDQMLPLNSLFGAKDSLNLVQDTIPLLSFDDCFSVEKETNMKVNFDFKGSGEEEESTLEVLSGEYNENPFLIENKLIHTMGTETYHGYKTISWEETYKDSSGKTRTRTVTETLHATVEKPKPFYTTQVVLNYGSQSGPDLSFGREASHLELKSEGAVKRHVKRGERKLKRLNDKAIKNNKQFTSMSNSEFEVLFNALNRNNEVQYRAVFTPLAQTNMVDLILSRVGYGDDFKFIKEKRMNKIICHHSQDRPMRLLPNEFTSYSFDVIKERFINKNIEFFKAVYFDFAPLLAIPSYQERPVHSLNPLPDYSRLYAFKEYEVLANASDIKAMVHPDTKTRAILKSAYVSSSGDTDTTCITAYSYDIEQRVDVVSVKGGDGYYHDVSVPWEEYLPLTASNNFYVTNRQDRQGLSVLSAKDGLCMYK